MKAFGGDIERFIPIISGFVAEVPGAAVPELRQLDGIHSVTLNSRVQLLGNIDGVDPNREPGSWLKVAKNTKLLEMWQHGFTGQGVDIALIDSGVAPVEGLSMQVINGPDLSFDSQAPNLTDVDTLRPRYASGRADRWKGQRDRSGEGGRRRGQALRRSRAGRPNR